MIDAFLGAPTADDWRTYTPVLRAKASEWKALEALTPGVRQRIAPILEFIPDWKTPGANKSGRQPRGPQTPVEFVARMLASSVAATPPGTRSFIYFGLAGGSAVWSGIDLWCEYATRIPTSARVIPLIDLPALENAPPLPEDVLRRGELALRLQANEVNLQLSSRIVAALRPTRLGAAVVHIIVDLKNTPAARSHAQIRAALGNAEQFAAVVVLGGIFPADLTGYQLGVSPEPRIEWTTWRREHVCTPSGDRMLSFGDYAPQHAHYVVPPEEARGSVSLRYTTDDAFLVFRGVQANSAAGVGYEQSHGHCKLLIARADYPGRRFSWGDDQIYRWSDHTTKKPGNPEQWRIASFTHHMTQVVVQVQDPTGSSDVTPAT